MQDPTPTPYQAEDNSNSDSDNRSPLSKRERARDEESGPKVRPEDSELNYEQRPSSLELAEQNSRYLIEKLGISPETLVLQPTKVERVMGVALKFAIERGLIRHGWVRNSLPILARTLGFEVPKIDKPIPGDLRQQLTGQETHRQKSIWGRYAAYMLNPRLRFTRNGIGTSSSSNPNQYKNLDSTSPVQEVFPEDEAMESIRRNETFDEVTPLNSSSKSLKEITVEEAISAVASTLASGGPEWRVSQEDSETGKAYSYRSYQLIPKEDRDSEESSQQHIEYIDDRVGDLETDQIEFSKYEDKVVILRTKTTLQNPDLIQKLRDRAKMVVCLVESETDDSVTANQEAVTEHIHTIVGSHQDIDGVGVRIFNNELISDHRLNLTYNERLEPEKKQALLNHCDERFNLGKHEIDGSVHSVVLSQKEMQRNMFERIALQGELDKFVVLLNEQIEGIDSELDKMGQEEESIERRTELEQKKTELGKKMKLLRVGRLKFMQMKLLDLVGGGLALNLDKDASRQLDAYRYEHRMADLYRAVQQGNLDNILSKLDLFEESQSMIGGVIGKALEQVPDVEDQLRLAALTAVERVNKDGTIEAPAVGTTGVNMVSGMPAQYIYEDNKYAQGCSGPAGAPFQRGICFTVSQQTDGSWVIRMKARWSRQSDNNQAENT